MNDRSPLERVLLVILNTLYLIVSAPLLLFGLLAYKLWEKEP